MLARPARVEHRVGADPAQVLLDAVDVQRPPAVDAGDAQPRAVAERGHQREVAGEGARGGFQPAVVEQQVHLGEHRDLDAGGDREDRLRRAPVGRADGDDPLDLVGARVVLDVVADHEAAHRVPDERDAAHDLGVARRLAAAARLLDQRVEPGDRVLGRLAPVPDVVVGAAGPGEVLEVVARRRRRCRRRRRRAAGRNAGGLRALAAAVGAARPRAVAAEPHVPQVGADEAEVAG